MITSTGLNTGSLFTFLKTIRSYAENFNTDQIYIAWDRKLLHGIGNFRADLSEGTYKGNRDQEKNKEVYESVQDIVEATALLGVKNIYPGRLEADDVISWLTTTLPGHKIIVSVDKDFVQLIGPEVSLFNPIKKQTVDALNVESVFGMTPLEYLYFKAIRGDVSDNIPGLEGYGEVKGAKLAKSFVLKDEKAIAPFKERVEHNLKLVDLAYGLKQYPEEIESYKSQHNQLDSVKADFDKFQKLCEKMEFASILNDMGKWKSAFNKKQTVDLLTEYFKMFE
jgi:5'-3' exonuclease